MPDGPKPPRLPAALVQELSAVAHAAEYGLSEAAFAALLAETARKAEASGAIASPIGSDRSGLERFLRALRLEELALARGCAAGNEYAWEVFLTRFRAKLYGAARAITREDSSAKDLADSIYAELYGTQERDGVRVSKLSFYGGRGSLEGWLRTVLAQEWVNRYRKQKRLVSLEAEMDDGAQFADPAPVNGSPKPDASPLVAATDASLAALPAEDRYILAAYFLDQRTLAEIGRSLKVHESTISRKVEKTVVALRKDILARMVRGGLSRRAAEEALDADVCDLVVDVRAGLGRSVPAGAKIKPPPDAAKPQETKAKPFPATGGPND